ncbi:MAG: hypothetical protein QXI84_09220 [Thermofilaceae archaeon]
MTSRQIKITEFFASFSEEVVRLFDDVESAGHAGGYMEWANGRVGNCEVYFLWFPRRGVLHYVVVVGGEKAEESVKAATAAEALAAAKIVISRCR